MSYTLYLFDFDYTLADSSHGILTCFHTVLTRHGYTEVTDDEIKRTIGKTLEEAFSILTGVTDPEQLAEFKKEYGREADEHMTVNTVLFPETKAVLTALKERGARVGIISTKYRFRIRELLKLHFPDDFMDIIIGGEDVTAPKPSPEGILLAMERLQAGKDEILFVGDSIIDAETAQAAGVDFAGVTHGVTTAEELGSYPHRKIMSTLEELPENRENEQLPAVPPTSALPEHPTPAPRRKKLIGIWHILMLAVLIWFALSEMLLVGSWFFPVILLLTLWGMQQRRRLLPDKVIAFIAPWWHPCKVRLRILHIRLINGKKIPPVSKETYTCQNCGTSYRGNYCHRCGQTHNTPRYRLSNALRNIVGGFTNIDNGFGRTLTELLYRPGFMIRDFISGKRVHYFRPFQTLFILAALYIMCVQLVDPDALEKKEKSQLAKKEDLIATRQEVQAGLDNADTPEEKTTLTLTLRHLDRMLAELEKEKVITARKEIQAQLNKANDQDTKAALTQTIRKLDKKLEELGKQDSVSTRQEVPAQTDKADNQEAKTALTQIIREEVQAQPDKANNQHTKAALTQTIRNLNKKLEELEKQDTATRGKMKAQPDKAKNQHAKTVLTQTIRNLDKELEKLEKQDTAAREDVKTQRNKADSLEKKKTLTVALKYTDKKTKKAKKDTTTTLAASGNTLEEDEDEGIVDEMLEDGSKIIQELEAYLQQYPFLMKVWNLMKSWGHGNKAFRIIATLPLFALATQMAFYRRKKKMKYNLTEHVFIQAYIACQILLLSILFLPFFGKAHLNDLYEVPMLIIFLLFCWDYKQLYGYTWWSSFWRTILMVLYSLILLLLFAIVVVILAAIAIHVLKGLFV